MGAGIPAFLSAPSKETNIHEVRKLLQGKTTVIAGPSGVGKSSLINRLQPEANMETGAVSRKIAAGKAYHPACGAFPHRRGVLYHGYAGI